MPVLRVSVAVILLSSVLLSSAQLDDQIVSKDFPANITCQRNRAQRNIERQQALAIGGNENLYRACYAYQIDSGECVVDAASLEVDRLLSFPQENSTLIMVDTPLTTDRVYPPNVICFFVIGNRRAGYVYQYFEAIEQDLEGSLAINTTEMDNIETSSVVDGTCQDFFEFRMKSQVNPREVLVTCGNAPDPRIRLSVDVAQALTLIFRSDGNVEQNRGVNVTIIEINTPAANFYNGNGGESRRKRSNIVAPKGPQGLHGDIGLPGAPGRPGNSGKDGIDGSMGRKGGRGIKGVRGPEGPSGTIEGTRGPTGLKGLPGPNGLPCYCSNIRHCTPGKQGEKGPPGPHGYRGDPGEKGPRGLPGQSGLRGIPGPKGRKGNRGPRGYNGLNGAPGNQGPPGRRGQPGSVGPSGLGGCPVPDHEMIRRASELGYITEVTKELYHGSSDIQFKKSVRRFHNHLVNKIMDHKKEFKNFMSSQQTASQQTASQVDSGVDHNRFTRQTKSSDELRESSFECGGIPILPGPKGEDGVRGPPGVASQNGIPGRPGINGAYGMAGDSGEPGMEGPSGSPGSKGYPGKKGIYGQRGEPGLPGQCSCFKYQKYGYHSESFAHHHTPSAGSTSSPKTRSSYYPGGYGFKGQHGDIGSRGPKGPPGYRGNAGSPGLPGVKGPMGYRGADGVTGRTGPSGLPGLKGFAGWRGLPGNAGLPGPPGPPGCVCNNLILYLDRYGFLVNPSIITEENSDEFDRVKANVTCTRMEDSPIIGLKGEQGSPGYPGPIGYPGEPGTDGRDGFPGKKGVKGVRGYVGQKGFQGSRGPPGKPGLPGSLGSQGYRGRHGKCILNPEDKSYYSKLIPTTCPEGCPVGHKGLRGDDGPTGPRGSPGYPGPSGYPGPRGPRGIAGLPGDPGDEGFAGSPGYRGPHGHRGLPGAPGPAGPPGPPGPSDNCPEFDGIDFDVFFRPTPEEMMNIEQLFATADVNLAREQSQATFPFLRELAGFISGGGQFPQPPVICVEIINTTVGKDLVTVEFRGTGPFTCQLDRQSSVPCSSPITYSRAKLLGGFHKVTITGANRTCMEITNFTLPLELNINPPVVDCDTVTITFSSNGRTQCQLDHRYFTYCKSPYHQSGLSRGEHTVTIRTTDGLGGYKQKSVTFTIILDKPQWSGWNEWSVCSRSCGTGRSFRRRMCVPAKCPDPYYRNCHGNSYEERKCNEQCCPERPQLSSWTYWSACSKSCGGGIQHRRRKCIPSSCPYSDPKYNKCYGSEYEERNCNEKCCPERPHWGEWKDWSACSRSCGGGLSYRRRHCYQSKCPHPYYKTCYGNDHEHKRCNEQCCPEKPYWGYWGQWSVCSKTCGGGISFRKRQCYQSKCPHPIYKKCTGSDYEEMKCNDRCCAAPIKFIGKPQVSYRSVKISYTSSLPTQCRLDWGTFEYCKSPYQQSNLKPGRHTLVVRNTGKTGCQEQNSVYFYIPDSKVYKPYSLEIKVTGVRQAKNCVWISYTLSHYASTLCSFDNKEWIHCYSPLYSCGLEPGKHTVSIKAIDRNSQKATINYKFTMH